MRFNKEYKLDICDNIYLKYGTTNKFEPNVIYITGRMWICPTYEGEYESIISYLHKQFKQSVRHELANSEMFVSKFILDFDIKADNLVRDKKKFYQIQVFVKQNPYSIIDLKNLKDSISIKFGSIFKDFEDALIENDFLVSKSKA